MVFVSSLSLDGRSMSRRSRPRNHSRKRRLICFNRATRPGSVRAKSSPHGSVSVASGDTALDWRCISIRCWDTRVDGTRFNVVYNIHQASMREIRPCFKVPTSIIFTYQLIGFSSLSAWKYLPGRPPPCPASCPYVYKYIAIYDLESNIILQVLSPIP